VLSRAAVDHHNTEFSLELSSRWSAVAMRIVAVSTVLCAGQGVAQAQQAPTEINMQVSAAIQKALQEQFSRIFSHIVRVTPSLSKVDPNTHAATIEFFNPSEDTISTDISVGMAPPAAGPEAPDSTSGGGGLMAEDASTTPVPKADTVAAAWSMASWIHGVPSKLTLAPHEKKSVTVQVTVPSDAKAGDYAAWVVTSTEVGNFKPSSEGNATNGVKVVLQDGGGSISGPDGKPLRLPSGGKIVYTVSK